MKQPGHEAITRQAVAELFRESGVGERVLGLTERDFEAMLNHTQAVADRILGPTLIPYRLAPDAQHAHGLARAGVSGDDAVADVRDFVTHKLIEAQGWQRASEDGLVGGYRTAAMYFALGAAVHALEDSFSGAHAYRDPQAPNDPHASILGINVFAWWPFEHTHDGYLDEVPLGPDGQLIRPTDLAAKEAVKELIRTFVSNENAPAADSAAAFFAVASSFIHGTNVHLSLSKGDPWWVQQNQEAKALARSDDWSGGKQNDGSVSKPEDEEAFSPADANATGSTSGAGLRLGPADASQEVGSLSSLDADSNDVLSGSGAHMSATADATPILDRVSDAADSPSIGSLGNSNFASDSGGEFFVPSAFGLTGEGATPADQLVLDPTQYTLDVGGLVDNFVPLAPINATEALTFTPMDAGPSGHDSVAPLGADFGTLGSVVDHGVHTVADMLPLHLGDNFAQSFDDFAGQLAHAIDFGVTHDAGAYQGGDHGQGIDHGPISVGPDSGHDGGFGYPDASSFGPGPENYTGDN